MLGDVNFVVAQGALHQGGHVWPGRERLLAPLASQPTFHKPRHRLVQQAEHSRLIGDAPLPERKLDHQTSFSAVGLPLPVRTMTGIAVASQILGRPRRRSAPRPLMYTGRAVPAELYPAGWVPARER